MIISPFRSSQSLAFDRHLDNGRKSRTKSFLALRRDGECDGEAVFRHIASLNRYIDEPNISHEISHLTLLTDSSTPRLKSQAISDFQRGVK